jgi:hypothetical protein
MRRNAHLSVWVGQHQPIFSACIGEAACRLAVVKQRISRDVAPARVWKEGSGRCAQTSAPPLGVQNTQATRTRRWKMYASICTTSVRSVHSFWKSSRTPAWDSTVVSDARAVNWPELLTPRGNMQATPEKSDALVYRVEGLGSRGLAV